MSDIKRYDPGKYGGDYVTFADHAAKLTAIRAEVEDMRHDQNCIAYYRYRECDCVRGRLMAMTEPKGER